MCYEHRRPAGAAEQASELSRDDILQHRLVQAEIGHQPLELGILFLELAQPLHLRRHQTRVLVAPVVVGRLADPCLPAHLADRVPSSACFSTKAICASENFVRFIVHSVSWPSDHNWNFPAPNGPGFGKQVNPRSPAASIGQGDYTKVGIMCSMISDYAMIGSNLS